MPDLEPRFLCLLFLPGACDSNKYSEAALNEADFPHSLEKKAGTAAHAFLHVRSCSENYPATSRPLEEPNVPLSC
ncbi:hypothetical protein GOODEAATRI_031915 [Goodea atripinnis]|uniref:Secreted protein n=1 Tax=Goodea atripinnis TaxID=208336 RepID=A0ABV0NFG2_9TELE